MTSSRQTTSLDDRFSVASISDDGRLVFPTTQELDRAWDHRNLLP